jgi:hypothetical protein
MTGTPPGEMISYWAMDKTAPRRPNSWFDAVLEAAKSQTDSKNVSMIRAVFFLLEEILKF